MLGFVCFLGGRVTASIFVWFVCVSLCGCRRVLCRVEKIDKVLACFLVVSALKFVRTYVGILPVTGVCLV